MASTIIAPALGATPALDQCPASRATLDKLTRLADCMAGKELAVRCSEDIEALAIQNMNRSMEAGDSIAYALGRRICVLSRICMSYLTENGTLFGEAEEMYRAERCAA